MQRSAHQPGSVWLRAYAAAGAKAGRAVVRLVCFPHAGGAASFYREWAELLPDSVEVLAVCYPGREDRFTEPYAERMADLADPVAEELAADARLPLALFGHSMGASVAAEVAARLEGRAGVRLERLFVSGREAPDVTRGRPGAHLHDDEAMAAEVLRLGGYGAEVLETPGLRELLLPIVRADYRLTDAYRPDTGMRLATPVTALAGDADSGCTPDEVRAWSRATSGPFDVQVFSGDHFFLVPHHKQVVALVEERLSALWSCGGAG